LKYANDWTVHYNNNMSTEQFLRDQLQARLDALHAVAEEEEAAGAVWMNEVKKMMVESEKEYNGDQLQAQPDALHAVSVEEQVNQLQAQPDALHAVSVEEQVNQLQAQLDALHAVSVEEEAMGTAMMNQINQMIEKEKEAM
jgi:hypothetical protein